MTARTGRLVAAGLIAIGTLRADVGHASVATLKRSLENISQGPLDVLLSPVVAARTVYRNVSAEEHSVAGTLGVGFVTWGGLFMVDAVASYFRMFGGLLEFPVGLGALAASPFTNWQPPVFFDVEKADALVDRPSSWFHLKFGVAHVGGRD